MKISESQQAMLDLIPEAGAMYWDIANEWQARRRNPPVWGFFSPDRTFRALERAGLIRYDEATELVYRVSRGDA